MHPTPPIHWKWTLLTLPVVAAGLLVATPARAEVECRWRGDRLECQDTNRDRRDRREQIRDDYDDWRDRRDRYDDRRDRYNDQRYNDRRRDSERRRCTYSSNRQEYVCR